MTTLTLQLPPNRTPVIQLYARIGGAAVGSPITLVEGAASIYTGTVPTGDYNIQLSGITTPNGLPFPLRDGIAYPGIPWTIIDATILVPPVFVYPTLTSACQVQLRAYQGAVAIKARVKITCGTSGRIDDFAFASIAFDGETASDGLLQVDLPWSSLAGVGRYRFQMIDIATGTVFHDRSVTVPDESSALYEALT